MITYIYMHIHDFGDNMYTDKTNIDEADRNKSILLENMIEFNNKPGARTKECKNKKINTFDSVSALYEGWELPLNASKSGIFSLKT